MDIHRCRFVLYEPASISALAFSHTSDLSQKTPPELRLALGRDNSDIEIWNPSGGQWLQETVLRGSVGATIEQLAWTQDLVLEESNNHTVARPGPLRLFSIGGTQTITEWSLTAGKPVRHAEGSFRDIWCFAAQPAYAIPKDGKVDGSVPAQSLVAGCADGTIVLFSTEDSDLRYSQILLAPASRKGKVLSITWRDRNTVVAGYEDGLIRVLDVPSRRVIRQMSLGKSPDGSKSIVWTVKCLADGTILSGDSSGELKIWDAQNFSLAQRLKAHEADVLEVVTSSEGDTIFTVGVDRRTIAYQPLPLQRGQKKQRRWAQALHRRYHDHDVKCAATYESKEISVLVSGGTDASPVVIPMSNWQSEYHRTLSHLPQTPQLSTSRDRLLLAWWGRELNIYLIPERSTDGEVPEGPDDYVLLATIQLKGDEHIQSAQISKNGNYLVASTIDGVRFFQLRRTTSSGVLALRSRSVTLPSSLQHYGARRVGFSPDCKWLYAVRFDNTILLSKITPSPDSREPPVFHSNVARLEPTGNEDDDGPLRTYTDTVSAVTFSSDSRVLAVGTLSGHMTSWTLEGHEDTQPEPSHPSTKALSSGSDSESSSDSDSDAEDDSPLIHAQKWTRTTQLPRLDSSILLLLFRSSTSSSPPTGAAQKHTHHLSSPQSNIALHPTRHTPHPVAHEHPQLTPLLALTSTHNLVELDISAASFTSWSRRNPASLLPERFKLIKDRAMGGFLHQDRLWLYGPAWLYMLDLSRDFPVPRPQTDAQLDGSTDIPSRKRKRSTGTGAGDKITNRRDRDAPVAATALKHKGDKGAMQLIKLDHQRLPTTGDDDGSDGPSEELVALRRSEAAAHTNANHTGSWTWANGDHDTHGEKSKGSSSHFFTFRYRGVFGLGVLHNPDDDHEPEHDGGMEVDADGDGGPGRGALEQRGSKGPPALEVVVVERPMYEVAQAPRFDGGQDWDV